MNKIYYIRPKSPYFKTSLIEMTKTHHYLVTTSHPEYIVLGSLIRCNHGTKTLERVGSVDMMK